MKNTKKFLSLLLVGICLVCLATGCKGSQGSASIVSNTPTSPPISRIGEETLQYPEKNEEYEYEVFETYVQISRYLGEDPDVTIPSTLEDLPVKVVGGFSFNKAIENVTLPEGVVIINNRAFDNCDNLETINIPESVIEIGAYAFDDSNSLKSLTIPKSVTKIGERAFGTRYESRGVLVVKFYKGTAAAEYIAAHSEITHEMIDE